MSWEDRYFLEIMEKGTRKNDAGNWEIGKGRRNLFHMQGLNLGPLLFLIYNNGLPICLPTSNRARVSVFADDTNISSHGANI